MKKINWMEVVEKNEDQILELTNEVFKKASLGNTNTGYSYSLILNKDGELRIVYLSNNNTTEDLHNGRAYCIYTKEEFNILDSNEDYTGIKWDHDLGGYRALENTWMANEIGTETILSEEILNEVKNEIILDLLNEDFGFDYGNFLQELKYESTI